MVKNEWWSVFGNVLGDSSNNSKLIAITSRHDDLWQDWCWRFRLIPIVNQSEHHRTSGSVDLFWIADPVWSSVFLVTATTQAQDSSENLFWKSADTKEDLPTISTRFARYPRLTLIHITSSKRDMFHRIQSSSHNIALKLVHPTEVLLDNWTPSKIKWL